MIHPAFPHGWSVKSLGTVPVFRSSCDVAAFEENRIPIYWQLIIVLGGSWSIWGDRIAKLLLKGGMGRAAAGKIFMGLEKTPAENTELAQVFHEGNGKGLFCPSLHFPLVVMFSLLSFYFMIYPVQSQLWWMNLRSILDGSLKLMASTLWLIQA